MFFLASVGLLVKAAANNSHRIGKEKRWKNGVGKKGEEREESRKRKGKGKEGNGEGVGKEGRKRMEQGLAAVISIISGGSRRL